MERNLKLKDGKSVGFHMANLGNPVWGHDLGWTIKTENLEECLEIITSAFKVKDQLKEYYERVKDLKMSHDSSRGHGKYNDGFNDAKRQMTEAIEDILNVKQNDEAVN